MKNGCRVNNDFILEERTAAVYINLMALETAVVCIIIYLMHGGNAYKLFVINNDCRVDKFLILDGRQPCI